jgi:hypothetical protein
MEGLGKHVDREGFRLRGIEMSRVDGFSDVVFGFALTLLVVSLEVPKTFAELHQSLRGFSRSRSASGSSSWFGGRTSGSSGGLGCMTTPPSR